MSVKAGTATNTGGTQRAATPRPRRPRRPSLGNEAFLDKALDLFLEQGFERTSIEAITAAAGMAKRTVYLRYGDKASLFKAALRRAIEAWIVPVERLRAAERGDLEETLVAIGQILVDNVLSPAGVRLMRLANAVSHIPEMGAYSVELGSERTTAYVADLFRRRLGRDLPQAEEAAEAFLHMVVGGPATTAAWGVACDQEVVDRRVRYGVRLFLQGLTAQSRAGRSDALQDEVLRLKSLLGEALQQVDERLERLEQTRGADLIRTHGAEESAPCPASSEGPASPPPRRARH
jgi:AcrR family transcriptional regulator